MWIRWPWPLTYRRIWDLGLWDRRAAIRSGRRTSDSCRCVLWTCVATRTAREKKFLHENCRLDFISRSGLSSRSSIKLAYLICLPPSMQFPLQGDLLSFPPSPFRPSPTLLFPLSSFLFLSFLSFSFRVFLGRARKITKAAGRALRPFFLLLAFTPHARASLLVSLQRILPAKVKPDATKCLRADDGLAC